MSEQLATRDLGVSRPLVDLYRRWSDSGCGLLITGNMMIDRSAISEPRQLVIGRDIDPAAVAPLAQAAKRNGAAVWAQLNHGGRQIPRYLSRHTTAPSAVKVASLGAFTTPSELTSMEINDIIERFAQAAGVAQEAGFDGVQIHAAHGYLISQFLSPSTNLRNDAWGGNPNRRMHLLLEVIRAVRDRVGDGFAVGVKLNSADFQRGGFDEAESLGVVQALDAEAVDLIEISGGTFEVSAMMGPPVADSTRRREAYFHQFAATARNLTSRPLMLTGGFRSQATMAAAIVDGVVDLVGIARPLAVDPGFARKVLDGKAVTIDLPRRRFITSRFDGLVEVAWYTHQLRRLARGQHPKTRLATSTAVLCHLATTAFQVLRT